MKCDVCGGTFVRDNLVQVVYPIEKCKECGSDIWETFACSVDCAIKDLEKRKKCGLSRERFKQ